MANHLGNLQHRILNNFCSTALVWIDKNEDPVKIVCTFTPEFEKDEVFVRIVKIRLEYMRRHEESRINLFKREIKLQEMISSQVEFLNSHPTIHPENILRINKEISHMNKELLYICENVWKSFLHGPFSFSSTIEEMQ